LTDADDLQLGAVTAATALNVTANNGDITDTVGQAISADAATLTAASGNVVLDNDLIHDFDTVAATAETIRLNDADELDLGPIAQTDATGQLEVIAGGAVTNTAGAIAASGNTVVRTDGADITLNDPANDFDGLVTLDTDRDGSGPANATVVQSDGTLQLGDVDAANITASTTEVGADINAALGVQSASGSASYVTNGGGIDLSNDSNEFDGVVDLTGTTVTLTDATALVLGSVAVAELNVQTLVGSITDNGGDAIVVGGATSLDAGNFDIELDNANLHDFSSSADFAASGGDIAINDQNGIQLGALSSVANTDPTIPGSNAGNLSITAAGDITQTAAATVQGQTTISNAGFDVSLNQANELQGQVDVAGVDVSLNNVLGGQATILGDLDVTGNLNVTADGNIVDGAVTGPGGDINVTGTTSLGGMSILLDDATNDFGLAVNVAAFVDVILNDLNSIVLGSISTPVTQSLRVTAGVSTRTTI